LNEIRKNNSHLSLFEKGRYEENISLSRNEVEEKVVGF
jgi:hypothetical protein